MNKTTWFGKVTADGKVMPFKDDHVIPHAIVTAMGDKLTGVEVGLQ